MGVFNSTRPKAIDLGLSGRRVFLSPSAVARLGSVEPGPLPAYEGSFFGLGFDIGGACVAHQHW